MLLCRSFFFSVRNVPAAGVASSVGCWSSHVMLTAAFLFCSLLMLFVLCFSCWGCSPTQRVGAPRRRPDSSCCRHPPPTPPALMRDHGRRRPYPLTTTATQAAAAQTPRPHLPLPPPHARARVPAPRPPWTDVAPPPQPVGTRSPRAYVPAYRTAGAARGAIDEPPTEAPPVGWLQRSPRGVWVGCVPGPPAEVGGGWATRRGSRAKWGGFRGHWRRAYTWADPPLASIIAPVGGGRPLVDGWAGGGKGGGRGCAREPSVQYMSHGMARYGPARGGESGKPGWPVRGLRGGYAPQREGGGGGEPPRMAGGRQATGDGQTGSVLGSGPPDVTTTE